MEAPQAAGQGAADREFDRTCEHCGEQNPPEFPSCWNCHQELPQLAGTTSRRPRRSAARSRLEWLFLPKVDDLLSPSAAPDGASRKVIAWELAAVLSLFWLPLLLSSIRGVLQSAGERTAWGDLQDAAFCIGAMAMIGYLAWRAGGLRAILGLSRRRLWAEPFWAMIIWCGCCLAFVPAGILREALDHIRWTRNDPSIDPHSLSWYLRPGTLLLAAFFEEVLFRAYLWARLTQLTRRPFLAVALSSALFSIYHAYDPLDSVSLFLFGALLGIIYAKSRSLWRIALAHWMFNLVLFYAD